MNPIIALKFFSQLPETITWRIVDFRDEYATVAAYGFVELLISGRQLQTECLVLERMLSGIDLLIEVDWINNLTVYHRNIIF